MVVVQAATAAPPPAKKGQGKEEQQYAIGIEDVRAAAERIAGKAVRTPVVEMKVDGADGQEEVVYLKAECLQQGGSFKYRGACNSIMALKEAKGNAKVSVVTHSSGNHAAALSLAASQNGADAYVVMPHTAPECKKNATLANGAKSLTLVEATMEAREAAAEKVMADTGAKMIPPYNSPLTMAGQGTVGLELMEQIEGLECIIVPCSGAGLISGIAVAAKAINPDVRVVAAEPMGTNDAADIFKSVAEGTLIQTMTPPDTIADGLRARMGSLTWPCVRDLVDAVVAVSEVRFQPNLSMNYSRYTFTFFPSTVPPRSNDDLHFHYITYGERRLLCVFLRVLKKILLRSFRRANGDGWKNSIPPTPSWSQRQTVHSRIRH